MMFDNDADFPSSELKRLVRVNLVWDLVAHSDASAMLERFGINPPSPGGAEVACAASHKRMALVKPLEDDFAYLSREITEIVIEAILGDAVKEIGEEMIEQLRTQYAMFLDAGARVLVASLMAAEMLEIVKKDTTP